MKLLKKVLGVLIVALAVCQINVAYTHAAKFQLNSFDILTKELYEDEVLKFKFDYTGEVEKIRVRMVSQYGQVVDMLPDVKTGEFDLYTDYYGGPRFELKVNAIVFELKDGSTVSYSSKCESAGTANCKNMDSLADKTVYIKYRPFEDKFSEYFNVKLDKAVTNAGNAVEVDVESSRNGTPTRGTFELANIVLTLTDSATKEEFSVFVDNGSFIIPSTVKPGTYRITYCAANYTDGKATEWPNKSSQWGSIWCEGSVEVTESVLNTSSYVFNNSNYDKHLETVLGQLDNDAEITVDANSSPIISKTLFEKIQSTNRLLNIDYQNIRWIFYGTDIQDPKTIDASVALGSLPKEYQETFKSSDLSKAVLLDFAYKGELPGRALVRVSNKGLKNFIETDTLHIYHYDESEKTVSRVAMNVEETNGYFEFYINHNSKYILSAIEMVDEGEMQIGEDPMYLDNKKKVEENRPAEDKTTLFIVLGIGAAVFIAAMVIPYLLANKEKKKEEEILASKQATQDQGFYDTAASEKDDEEGEGYIESMK